MVKEVTCQAVIDETKCVGCAACLSVCPEQAIRMKKGWITYVLEDICVSCGTCVSICHRNAPFLQNKLKC